MTHAYASTGVRPNTKIGIMGPHYLNRLFAPRAIAVFGAGHRPDSVGTKVYENVLREGFQGPVYPINPKYDRIGKQRCYAAIDQISGPVDLAVIATPAATVADIIRQCGEHGVGAAIVVSAGFAETGARQGEQLQRAMLSEARRYGMRILGPNCLGLLRPDSHLNATFSKNTATPGSLALVSQSGALCTAILDWAVVHQVGFSAVVSLGSAADLDFGDVLDYLALDPHTRSILLYVEGIRDARSFMSGLRVAARMKPVIVVKSGRHAEGTRAAVSHTGALVGADDVFDAALRRAGVVRAMTIEQLFAAAQLLSTHHRVRGNRLAIITNGGGAGVMATDRAVDLGVAIAQLSESTVARLNEAMPPHWSHSNPVDILGDAPAERYGVAVQACLEDSAVDGVLVMLAPQAMTEPVDAAQAVLTAADKTDKPVLACWMGEQQVEPAWALFAQHKIPTFSSPEASVEAFAYLATHHHNQQLLMQVPAPLAHSSEPDIDGAQMIIDGALAEGRSLLSSAEARALLATFGIGVMPAMEARSANEALVAAESVGLPVAMKISSPDIAHKSDVNGVRLNVSNALAVRTTYNDLVATLRQQRPDAKADAVTVERMYSGAHGRELLVGVLRDPVFGPVISFGAGGTTVEIHHDRAVALPPLNNYIARNLIARTRVSRLLEDFRNMPGVKLDAVVNVLRRVSELVCELPRIKELEINPLMADERGAVALDVRVVVDRAQPSLERYQHMAIHPYPAHLVSRWQLPDGTDITIRPIRPEDAEIERTFVRELSPRAKYFRFMQALHELSPEMLVRFTQIDYDREMALIAVIRETDRDIEVGVTRYAINPDHESCEFALVVSDAWQQRGIGSRLLTCLMEAARTRGLRIMEGEVLADNRHMLDLARSLGFATSTSPQDPSIKVVSKAL